MYACMSWFCWSPPIFLAPLCLESRIRLIAWFCEPPIAGWPGTTFALASGVLDYEKLPVNLFGFIAPPGPLGASNANWCGAALNGACYEGRPGIVLFARWFLVAFPF